jgi:hypothetical protein
MSTIEAFKIQSSSRASIRGGFMTLRSLVVLLLLAGTAQAAEFHGVAKPYGKGQCIVLNRLPADSGAKYKSTDADKEEALCGIDFTDKGIGMCPKTWSTSPGTVIYDIRKSQYNGNPEKFEAEYCPKQRALKGKVDGVDRIATYKQSINGQFKQSTSATYAQASPLYYEYSRYFNTTVDIPVAVIRTMDAREHFRRVASKGHAIAQGKMIANGWNVVTSAEKNPTGYIPVNEFYYGDPKDDLLYGTMLKGPGARYGAEFNGDIVGKGYSAQYVFLQKTPALLALSNPKGFSDAASNAINASKADSVVARSLGAAVSNEQMMFWMQEMSDIVLMDYIFGQQDRPGNIDYLWIWYSVDDKGELKSTRADSEVARAGMGSIAVPDEVKSRAKYYLIQKTQINDNDAAGRAYANFTKRFELLEKLRHMNAVTYRQLVRLAKDYQAKGPLYRYLNDTFYMPPAYTNSIIQNSIQAAQIVQSACKAGTLRFDLNAETYLATQKVEEVHVNCDNP